MTNLSNPSNQSRHPSQPVPRTTPPGAALCRASVFWACILPGCVLPAQASLSAHQDTTHPPLPSHAVPRPGYLGVSLRDLDASEATHLHLRPTPANAPNVGAMIVTVDRDAPAWSAGLRPRDIVLELDGQPIDDVELLRRRLRDFASGDTITLRVWRGGSQMSFAVTLGDQDTIAQDAFSRHLRSSTGTGNSLGASSFSVSGFGTGSGASSFTGSAFTGTGSALLDAPPAPGTPSDPRPAPNAGRSFTSTLLDALIPSTLYTGLSVSPLTPQLALYFGTHAPGGLLVTAVAPNSPAANAGLAAGDVILSAQSRNQIRSITTRSGLARAVSSAHGGPIALAVMRAHQQMTLSLQPSKRKKL